MISYVITEKRNQAQARKHTNNTSPRRRTRTNRTSSTLRPAFHIRQRTISRQQPRTQRANTQHARHLLVLPRKLYHACAKARRRRGYWRRWRGRGRGGDLKAAEAWEAEVRHLRRPEARDFAPELVDRVVDAVDVWRDAGEGRRDVRLDARDVLVDLLSRWRLHVLY